MKLQKDQNDNEFLFAGASKRMKLCIHKIKQLDFIKFTKKT